VNAHDGYGGDSRGKCSHPLKRFRGSALGPGPLAAPEFFAVNLAVVLAWYFGQLPPSVPSSGCVIHNDQTLLYIGIAPNLRRRRAKPARARFEIGARHDPPPRRFITGADAIATTGQKIADRKAQIEANRDLSRRSLLTWSQPRRTPTRILPSALGLDIFDCRAVAAIRRVSDSVSVSATMHGGLERTRQSHRRIGGTHEHRNHRRRHDR
jgi:hypothetical protein